MKKIYTQHAGYNQGRHKRNEHGLDVTGNFLIEKDNSIGVRVKFHRENNQPTDTEWLKFPELTTNYRRFEATARAYATTMRTWP